MIGSVLFSTTEGPGFMYCRNMLMNHRALAYCTCLVLLSASTLAAQQPFSYRDFQEAFQIMRSGNSGKVILNWEELIGRR